MKNISTLIQAVFGISILVLFVLYFNLKKSITPTLVETTKDTTNLDSKDAEVDSILSNSKVLNFPIAFVNVDSIAENFDYFIQKREIFEKSMENKTKSLMQKEASLNSEYEKFVEKIQNGTTTLVTREDVEKAEMGFQKRQQDIYVEKQKFDQSMMQEEAKLVSEINKSIDDFLKKYKEELNYSYVLQKGGGVGALLYANENLDITAEVLKALNKEYASKAKAK